MVKNKFKRNFIATISLEVFYREREKKNELEWVENTTKVLNGVVTADDVVTAAHRRYINITKQRKHLCRHFFHLLVFRCVFPFNSKRSNKTPPALVHSFFFTKRK